MIKPDDLLDNLVAALQAVPDLVRAMGSEADRIFAYKDVYPVSNSLRDAIMTLRSPSIMVAWNGASLAGEIQRWRHRIGIYVRAGLEVAEDPEDDDVTPLGFNGICYHLWNGRKTSSDLPIKYLTIHASCNPMNPAEITRVVDEQGIDYFEFATSFDEIGDD